jgi:hypothetical protein
MTVVVEVMTVDGGLPGFLGASCSDSAFSTPVVSVSMSVVLRGAKKLQAGTAFGCSFTAADVGTELVDLLAACVRYASSVSFGPRSCHPRPLIPLGFRPLYNFVLPVHSPQRRRSVHSVLPCPCRKER